MKKYIHFINFEDDTIISKQLVSEVPRVHDEVRFSNQSVDIYYKVVHVVWVYDEEGYPYERVNIGLALINDSL